MKDMFDGRFSKPIDRTPMERRYDVVIVGAGPAGSAAAYHCASAGLSTLLVDRKSFPRPKVCGDGLTPRALRGLARMKLESLTEGCARILGIRFIRGIETGEFSYAHEPAPFDFGVVIPRLLLDNRIRQAAEGAGAEFAGEAQATALAFDSTRAVKGVWVHGAFGTSFCEARMTILADGANGRLSRKLRGDGRATAPFRGFALRQYLSGIGHLDPYFHVYTLPPSDGFRLAGYAWVFPVDEGIANVGVGILTGNVPRHTTRLDSLFSEFIERLALTDHRFTKATPMGPIEGGPLSTSMLDPWDLPPGVLRIGDAAGLVNPFTGEGIAYAIESGELAGQSVANALRASNARSPSSSEYARTLVTRHGRLWRLRASRRHLPWLLSSNLSKEATRNQMQVLRAVRNVALDQEPVQTPCPTASTEAFLNTMRARVAARLRRTDALLAELGYELCATDAPALLPLVIASQLGTSRTLQDSTVRRGLLATTLFSLAADILREVRDPAGNVANRDNTLAITVGDCLVTEATALAARLPQGLYQIISTACLTAVRALLIQSSKAAEVQRFESYYDALAAPTLVAASLVMETANVPEARSRATLETIRWYARTSFALAQLAHDPPPGLTEYIRMETARTDADSALLPPALQSMIAHLRATASAILEGVDPMHRSA
jgi:geranylgeranyl reductase family protein